jgi:hypothetical protein
VEGLQVEAFLKTVMSLVSKQGIFRVSDQHQEFKEELIVWSSK